jgi:uncharacterized protein (DUF58 family)
MTNRGRWITLLAIVGLIIGMCRIQITVSVLSLSVLLWVLWEWTHFWLTTRRELSGLKITRSVQGRTAPSGVLWAGRNIDVQVQIQCQSTPFPPDRFLRDVIPENIKVVSDGIYSGKYASASSQTRSQRWKVALMKPFLLPEDDRPANRISLTSVCQQATFRYTACVLSPGEVVFPGVHVLFEDRMKLFQLRRLVKVRQSFRVLPSHFESAEPSPIVKHINALPQHGIHRQQRSGMGFELLELREYMPGDPPKSIAWKASARRDKLMTRQYESEIPVRVQLFIDGTASTRIGGFGQRMLDQMTHVAASVAHSAISIGDAVGSYLMDEQGIKRIPAGLGNRAFQNQLQAMAEFSVNHVPQAARLSWPMMETAHAMCGERYPELMERHVNPERISLWHLDWSGKRRVRNQIAGIVAELHNLTAAEQVQLLFDDGMLARSLQRFLTDEGMPWMEPIISTSDLAASKARTRIGLMSKCIATAVSQAHDNEVFVICIELLHNACPIEDLLTAIKLARARHHRVAVICPSPTFRRPPKSLHAKEVQDAAGLRMAAEHLQLRERASHLKRMFARLKVPMTISGETSAIPLILSEIAVARTGRLATHGALR